MSKMMGINKLENKRCFVEFLESSLTGFVEEGTSNSEVKFTNKDSLMKDLLTGAFTVLEEVEDEAWLIKRINDTELTTIVVL